MKRIMVIALSVLLALVVASPMASAQVGQGAKASGKAAELAADWWIWALTNPVADNPLFGGDPNYNEEQCDGQPVTDTPGKKWFLAGTLDGSEVERTCTMPVGTQLFFPVVNVAVFPFPEETEEEVLAQANEFIDSVLNDPELTMSVTVDGKEIKSKRLVRAEAPLFSGESPLLDPNSYQAVADGLWAALPPLSKGEHTIHIVVKAPKVDVDPETPGIQEFSQNVTYHLTVQ